MTTIDYSHSKLFHPTLLDVFKILFVKKRHSFSCYTPENKHGTWKKDPLEKEKHLQITNFWVSWCFIFVFQRVFQKKKHHESWIPHITDQQITQLSAFPGFFCGVGISLQNWCISKRCRQKNVKLSAACVPAWPCVPTDGRKRHGSCPDGVEKVEMSEALRTVGRWSSWAVDPGEFCFEICWLI